jgi:hypothetical protein
MAKKKHTNNQVSADDVLAWLGTDATIEEVADILADIANGKYLASDLRQEVSDYNEE